MARSKKSKSRAPDSRMEALKLLLASPLGAGLRRAMLLALLLLVGGVVVRSARAKAYALPAYRMDLRDMAFTGLPSWADATLKRTLLTSSYYIRDGVGLDTSVFSADAEARVISTATRHPAIKGVRKVEVRFPGKVSVVPVLRRPVAMVTVSYVDVHGRRRQEERLLADDGTTLPVGPYEAIVRKQGWNLPVIKGIREASPHCCGVPWVDGDAQVAEAVSASSVAEQIRRAFRGKLVITTIDVSRFPAPKRLRGRGEVEFLAKLSYRDRNRKLVQRSITINWGRTERDLRGMYDEDTTRPKIARLMRALRAGTASYIDVRHPDEVG